MNTIKDGLETSAGVPETCSLLGHRGRGRGGGVTYGYERFSGPIEVLFPG